MVKVNPIEQLLDQFDTLILDGALATELEKLDCDLEDPLWSARVLLDEPEKIRKVHYAYFEAGADIAITASYQASIDGFKKRGISEADARALMKKTVELAQQAREDYWMEKRSIPSLPIDSRFCRAIRCLSCRWIRVHRELRRK